MQNEKQAISNRITKQKWKKTEHNRLIKLVETFGRCWAKISKQMKSRSARQCMQKYMILTQTKTIRKWTIEENNTVRKWVKNYGLLNWEGCSKMIKTRTTKQCENQWFRKLSPTIKNGKWTDEEQFKIWELIKTYSTNWSKMNTKIVGRNSNSIKNFVYNSLRSFQKTEIFKFIKKTICTSKQKSQVKGKVILNNILSCECLESNSLDKNPFRLLELEQNTHSHKELQSIQYLILLMLNHFFSLSRNKYINHPMKALLIEMIFKQIKPNSCDNFETNSLWSMIEKIIQTLCLNKKNNISKIDLKQKEFKEFGNNTSKIADNLTKKTKIFKKHKTAKIMDLTKIKLHQNKIKNSRKIKKINLVSRRKARILFCKNKIILDLKVKLNEVKFRFTYFNYLLSKYNYISKKDFNN